MLTLFHDYTDPASAVAVARLHRLSAEGLAVAFEGFEAIGLDVTLPVGVEVLAALERLAPLAADEGIVLHRPLACPPTARAHLLGAVAESAGLGTSWRTACYRAYWRDALDLADPEVLARLGSGVGLAVATVAGAVRNTAAVAAWRRSMTAHRRQGVGGVPTILAARTLVPGLLPDADLRALAWL